MFNAFIFGVFPIIFTVMFVTIFCFFIYGLISNIKTKIKNDNSPLLKVAANIVDKRTNTIHHNNNNIHNTTTSYFVTFEFESGDRLELEVDSSEYGYMIIGDYGDLEFQGTRFVSFARY